MTSLQEADLNDIFHALAHPIRRSLLESLASGPDTIVRLAQPHAVSLNAVSKHVKTLEAAGLISRSRDRTYHRIALEPLAMRPALAWMEHYGAFWSENLNSLKHRLETR
jgi:DNA-binding transcriptional ArsR family regulator